MEDDVMDETFFCSRCGNQFSYSDFGSLDTESEKPVCEKCALKLADREWQG